MNNFTLTYETPETLEMNTEAQDAVFHVSFGWTGGPAGAPVLDLESGRPIKFNGSDIYLDDYDAYDMVDEMVLEKGETASSYIKIAANITLIPDSEGSEMLPPEEDGGDPIFQPSGYTAVKINKLYDVLAVNQWGEKPE